MGYGKKQPSSVEQLDSSLVQKDKKLTTENAGERLESTGAQVDEEVFFRMLKRREQSPRPQEDYNLSQIYRKMRIFSTVPLNIPELRYYKFPFSAGIRNDGSDLFKVLYTEWAKSVQSAYVNFKKNIHGFYLKFGRFLVCLDKVTKVSLNFKSTLDRNEIRYSEKDGWLFLEATEVKLVFDLITNMPVDGSFEMPFVISKYAFENSILYHTKVVKKPTVKQKDALNYHYEIENHFIGHDYSALFCYDTKVYDS